jgi:hypothetical protein
MKISTASTLGFQFLLTVGLGVSVSVAKPVTPDPAATTTDLPPGPPVAPEVPNVSLIRVEIAKSESRLSERIASLKPDQSAKWMPGIFVALGALIAAIAGFLTQRAKLSAEDRLSRRTAGRQAIADIMDFRSRQLNEFYAPIRALLGQGLAIRNQLYDQLLANPLAGSTFYYKAESIAATGQSLWFKHAGVDKPFRMIDELRLLHAQFPQLMPLVDQILETGDATAKLIREHGGLALPDNDKLTEMLGAFLAHHAILKQIRASVASPTVIAYTAIYPRGFDRVIKEDFEKLAGELNTWQSSARALVSA